MQNSGAGIGRLALRGNRIEGKREENDAAAALRTRRGRAWLLSDPRRSALLRTTITPTVLTGSPKTNIIPQEASAELDIRLLPDEDTLVFRRELERVIADPKITLESIGDMAPPYDAPLDTELFHAVERVAAGDAVFSPRLAGFVLDAFAGSGAGPSPLDPELDQLTPRERDVLRLIARGYTYKEIARELVLSVKTIETHVSAVLRKLQLSNRHELSRWATDRRLF